MSNKIKLTEEMAEWLEKGAYSEFADDGFPELQSEYPTRKTILNILDQGWMLGKNLRFYGEHFAWRWYQYNKNEGRSRPPKPPPEIFPFIPNLLKEIYSMEEVKHCHACNEMKPLSHFSKDGHGSYRAKCELCEWDGRLEYAIRSRFHPRIVRAAKRWYAVREKYGLIHKPVHQPGKDLSLPSWK